MAHAPSTHDMPAMKALPLLLMILAFGCQAAVYKWTDSQGRVHYTDTPPPRQTAQAVRTGKSHEAEAEASRKILADRLADSEQRRQQTREAEEKRRQAEEEARRKEDNCRRAREQLTRLQGSGNVARLDERGQPYILGDAERQAAISEARKRIGEFCR